MENTNPWNEFVKKYYKRVDASVTDPVQRIKLLAAVYRTKRLQLRPRLLRSAVDTPMVSMGSYDRKVAQIEYLTGQLEEHMSKAARLETELTQCQSSLVKYKEKTQFFMTENENLTEQLIQTQRQMSELQANRKSPELRNHINNLNANIEQFQIRIAELQAAKRSSAPQKILDLQAKLSQAEGQIASLQDKLNMAVANRKSPELVAQLQGQISQYERRIAELQTMLEAAKRSSSARRKIEQKYNKRVNELERAKAEIKALQDETKSLKDNIAHLLGNAAALQNENVALKDKIEQLAQGREVRRRVAVNPSQSMAS